MHQIISMSNIASSKQTIKHDQHSTEIDQKHNILA